MATALNLGNANGKTITLRNPDTNNSDISVEMDKVVVKDVNGNVGIGVTPSSWSVGKSIEVGFAGNGLWCDATNEIFMNSNVYYNAGMKYASNGYATQYKHFNGNHEWKTAPSGTAGNAITWTNAMTLNASGNLLVGTSTTSYNHTFSKASGTNYTFQSINSTATGDNYNMRLYHESTGLAGSFLVCQRSNGSALNILSNGNVINTNGSYGAISDIKLKENIVDTSPKLDKLMKVRVVNYNLIGDEQKQIGVIAQEIEKIFPSVVSETKDTKQVEVEKEDGTKQFQTVETGEVTKNVKYSVIYMMMLKAMQEQQEIINDLKTRIEILEGGK